MKIEMITPKSDQQQGSASRRAALHPNPPTSTRARGAGMLPLPLPLPLAGEGWGEGGSSSQGPWLKLLANQEPKKNHIQSVIGRIAMKYSTQVKPLSYLKANAAEVIRQLTEQREIDAGLATPAAAAVRKLRARNAQRQTAKE